MKKPRLYVITLKRLRVYLATTLRKEFATNHADRCPAACFYHDVQKQIVSCSPSRLLLWEKEYGQGRILNDAETPEKVKTFMYRVDSLTPFITREQALQICEDILKGN